MAMRAHTRKGNGSAEGPFEKVVILPYADDNDLGRHAWADARFATDIMSEHGLFFALLMPPEIAAEERKQALAFSGLFADLNKKIEAMEPPRPGEVKAFVRQVTEEIKSFIEYKAARGDEQRSGKLRSLVWPLFFDHTRQEAERWVRRLDQLAAGETEYDRSEVAAFWDHIMEEHAEFVAHLLDPTEVELIDKANRAGNVFRSLDAGGIGGALKATIREPAAVVKSLAQNPETDAVLSAAQTILDFKTQAARDIEGARIKSIIDPRLADHVRREALKFVDELKRAV
jgi:hypothetical protein